MSTRFKQGQTVVKLFSIRGHESAAVVNVIHTFDGKVYVGGDSHLYYDATTGLEVDPALAGCSSRLIPLDGDDSPEVAPLHGCVAITSMGVRCPDVAICKGDTASVIGANVIAAMRSRR